MKKILILTNSEHAYQGAGGRTRILSEIAVLKSLQLNIVILCIVPLKKFLKPGNIRKATNMLRHDSKVKVFVIPSIPTSHFVVLAKVSNVINAFILYLISKIFGIEAIHAHGTVIAYSAVLLKKLGSKVRIITDVHGCVSAEYKYESESYEEKWVHWLEEIEKRVIHESDEVIFVSDRMKDYYQNLYHNIFQNTHLINCACNSNPMVPLPMRENKRKELNLEDKIVFVYLGSFRKYQMAEETVNLFIEIKKQIESAHFLILTSHQKQFMQALSLAGVKDIDYTITSVRQEEVPNFLCAADFGFLLRENSIVNMVASPTKYAEYLMSGVPVIITNNIGDYSDFTTLNDTGFVLQNFTCSLELINYVNRTYQKRAHYYQHCFTMASEKLSWNFAGIWLKNIYAFHQK